MKIHTSVVSITIALLLLVVILFVFSQVIPFFKKVITQEITPSLHTPSLSPTPYIFKSFTPPTIEKKPVYKIVMIGDSMTAALGPHGGSLSEELNTMYKENDQFPQRIIIDNYAVSSNILAVGNQLTLKTTISEYTFEPLLNQEFDLILIESFGYNPLSEFGLEEGIKRQNMALDKLMTKLITTHPHSVVIFIATIAPNRENYARSTQPDTSTEDIAKLADERIAYIKNHIEYAKNHNIPLINVYEKSLTQRGDGDIRYINPNDDIHPSFEGIDLIAQEIAKFIYDNKILPL